MFNKKQQVLMSAMLLSSAYALTNTNVKTEASYIRPNHLTTNVTPVHGGEYELDNGFPIPIALKVDKYHRDYNYLNKHNLRAKDGNIYLYLQSYKDQIYYYSPILREYRGGGAFKSDGINRDVYKKIEKTSMMPINSAGKGDAWLPGNSRGEYSRGQSDDKNFTKPTKTVSNLHHYLPSGAIDYNFRTKTILPPSIVAWTPENLKPANSSYSDGWKLYYGSWKLGEFRQIGYHLSGENFVNPYFPVDGMRPNGSAGIEDYDMLPYPWGRAANRSEGSLISEIDEKVYQYLLYTGEIPLDKKVNKSESRTHRQNVDKSINWNSATIADYKAAYKEKWLSMQDVYNRSPKVRANKLFRNMTRIQTIDALTEKYGSLSSSPLGADANLSVAFGREYDKFTNAWYSVNVTIPGQIHTTKIQDVQIKRQQVYSGGLLQTFNRYKQGSGYGTSLTNNSGVGSQYPEVEPGSTIRVDTLAIIDDAYASYTKAKGILQMEDTITRKKASHSLPNNGMIHKNGSTFVKNIKVPNNTAGQFQINSELDKKYYNTYKDMLWDSTANTAYNILEIKKDNGSFQPIGMDLINKNGQVVEHPIPGHEYKIRYKYRYNSFIAKNIKRTGTVKLTYDIGREMRGPVVSGHENQGKRTLYPTNTSTTAQMYNGKEYHFETPYNVYETGQLDSMNVLNADIEDEITETRQGTSVSQGEFGPVYSTYYYDVLVYDYFSLDGKDGKDWISDYDLSVENINVIPREIENSHTQVSPALVKFDINYKTPSFIKDLGHDVDVTVKIGDQIVESKQHIRNGLNRNISIPVDTVYLGNQNSLINAEVFINSNKDIYESDDGVKNIKSTNNYGTGQGRVNRPSVVPFRDSNNFTTWNQYFNKNNWFGQSINYQSFSGPQIQFNRFTNPDNQRSEYKRFYEEYKIDEVRFRSRLTRQEQMGKNKDGWINLLKEDGYIKAGYGYELEIDVSYNTDADITDYNQTGLSGKWSRPRLTEPLLQDNIYVQLPNNKIRSVQGDSGTEGQLRLKSTQGNKLDKKWTFEIDGGNSLGVDTTGRFYFGEEVTDGRYSINVFTPKIRGVNGKMTSANSILEHLLYDSKNDLGIHVIGADVDDITDHINK